MDDGEDQDAVRSLLVEDDVRAAFVAPDPCPDPLCSPAHARIVGQELKGVLQDTLITLGLGYPKFGEAVEENVEDVGVGAASELVITHAECRERSQSPWPQT